MEFLVSWLHALISLVLLLALAELILPDGSMQPYVRVILGVVLVVAILRPAVQLGAFDWRLPALTLPAPAGDGAVAQGEHLAQALQEQARQEAEGQVALQAARLLELRLGVRPEAITVGLSPDGWVERIDVALGRGARAGPVGRAPETGRVEVALEVSRVEPVMVGPVRVGEGGEGTEAGGILQTPASPAPDAGDSLAGQVQTVLAGFYQVPLERVQVKP